MLASCVRALACAPCAWAVALSAAEAPIRKLAPMGGRLIDGWGGTPVRYIDLLQRVDLVVKPGQRMK